MRIATWNVNSVRSRADRIVSWLQRQDVDVLAIQETKCKDEQFPYERFSDIGYQSAHVGLNQWNGVAILSRIGLEDIHIGFPDQPGFGDPLVSEARAIAAVCGGMQIWSMYTPNGRTVGDPHYVYKLDWLAKLHANAANWLSANPQAHIALAGDWNVAPLDEDVWDITAFHGATHVSQPERDAIEAFKDIGFHEVTRAYTPGPGVYTYWDYTQLRFPKKQGMRIDYILASPALAERIYGASIDRQERKGKGASDHAPVIVDIE